MNKNDRRFVVSLVALTLSVLTGPAEARQSFQGLGDLPGSLIFSTALDVSADGLVVVGQSASASGFEVFRWTSGGGMVGLGDLAGGIYSSSAKGVSADGLLVVGSGYTASGQEAFIWDATNGMQNLQTVLVSLGLDLTGWTLTTALGISADGAAIVGQGINPLGDTEAFIAIIPVPCPADITGDGAIDVLDLIELLAKWGECP